MVAGKARLPKSMMQYVVEDRRDNRLLHAMLRDVKLNPAGGTSSRRIGTASNISPISDDSLKVSGGTMVGPIAFFSQVFSISSNESDTLRIDENFGAYTTRVLVTGEGAAADNIEFIIGKDDGMGNTGKAAFDGQLLIIDATLTTPLTLVDGTDISLPGAINVVIPGGENAMLIYDSTQDKWNLISVSNAATAGGPFLPLAGGVMAGNIDMDGFSLLMSPDGITEFSAVNEIFLWQLDASSANDVALGLASFDLGPKIIIMDEFGSTPGAALANTGRLYLKEVGGTHAELFYKDELNTETNLISDFATTELDNLGVTAINSSMDPNADGTLDLGSPSLSWNTANLDQIKFRHNDGIDATLPSIGRSSNALRINSPTGNATTMEINAVEEYSFDSLAFRIKNLNSLIFLDGSDNDDVQFLYADPVMTITAPHWRFEANDVTPSHIFLGGNSSDGLVAVELDLQAEDDAFASQSYAKIVARINDSAAATPLGELELQVTDASGDGQTYAELNGLLGTVRILKEMSMNSNKIASIGTATITDLTEELVPTTGDFIFGFEATSGAMRKFDIGNLPGGGGGDMLLGTAQTVTALKTFDVGASAEGILMADGTKLEFEDGSTTNLEMHAQESVFFDPADFNIGNRSGLEIDINPGGNVIFHIGDGQADPWILVDEDSLSLVGTPATAANGYPIYLRNHAALHSTGSGDICNLLGMARTSALESSWFNYGRVNFSAEVMSGTANVNEGGVRLQAASNDGFRTGIRVLGVGAGVSNTEVGFYNNGADHSTQQSVSGVTTSDSLSLTQTKVAALQDALDALGLVLKT